MQVRRNGFAGKNSVKRGKPHEAQGTSQAGLLLLGGWRLLVPQTGSTGRSPENLLISMLNHTYFGAIWTPKYRKYRKIIFWRKFNFAGSGVRNFYFAGIPSIAGRLAWLIKNRTKVNLSSCSMFELTSQGKINLGTSL